MRMFKTVAAALVALLLLGGFAAPAFAQASPCPPGQPTGRPPGTPPNDPGPPDGRPPQYPPGRCNLTLSQSAAERGQSVQARGDGFVPGETVVFSLGGRELARAVADPQGVAVADLTVPTDAAFGRTEVTARGQAQVLNAAFEVLPGAAANNSSRSRVGAGALSRTGSDIAFSAVAGAALVAVGGLLVLTARRRRGLATA